MKPLKLDTDTQVFFYEQDFYVLSNFSSFRVKWVGVDFDTAEHAYHFEKFWATEGGSTEQKRVRGMIMNSRSAHEAFKIAQEYRHLQREGWDAVKVGVMGKILRAKADQHGYVRRKLLDTGNRLLIENSWRDDFWGWGPNRDGKNMLGKCWMQVRASLQEEQRSAELYQAIMLNPESVTIAKTSQ